MMAMCLFAAQISLAQGAEPTKEEVKEEVTKTAPTIEEVPEAVTDETGADDGTRATDYNSSRSNKHTTIEEPDEDIEEEEEASEEGTNPKYKAKQTESENPLAEPN